MFKVNNKDIKTTPWHRSDVFIVNFEHISHLVLEFLLLNLNMQLLAGLKMTRINQMQDLNSLSKPKLLWETVDIKITVCLLVCLSTVCYPIRVIVSTANLHFLFIAMCYFSIVFSKISAKDSILALQRKHYSVLVVESLPNRQKYGEKAGADTKNVI